MAKESLQLPVMFDPDQFESLVNSEDGMANWSESKRDSFCKTLNSRVQDAQWIYRNLADILFSEGKRLFFIGQGVKVPDGCIGNTSVVSRKNNLITRIGIGSKHNTSEDTSLTSEELSKILIARANIILKHLPSHLKVISVVNPDVAQKLKDICNLDKKAVVLEEEINSIDPTIDLTHPDIQDMTVSELRKEMKSRQTRRKEILEKLKELRSNGSRLQDFCNKALYKGVKDLETELLAIIDQMLERAIAYSQLMRRTAESIKFGDSVTATAVFKEFSLDEVVLQSDVAVNLSSVVKRLQDVGKKTVSKKAIKSPVKKAPLRRRKLPAKKKSTS